MTPPVSSRGQRYPRQALAKLSVEMDDLLRIAVERDGETASEWVREAIAQRLGLSAKEDVLEAIQLLLELVQSTRTNVLTALQKMGVDAQAIAVESERVAGAEVAAFSNRWRMRKGEKEDKRDA